jgi:hypothetical protein
VTFFEATPAGVRELRRVELPIQPDQIEWDGGDPVVMTDDGALGRITARGYEALPQVPAASWAVAPPDEGLDHFDSPQWKLIVTPGGEIWQGRCEWGYIGDGDDCTEFVYARVDRPPGEAPEPATHDEPVSGREEYKLPAIPPSTAVKVELFEIPSTATPDQAKPELVKLLRCTQGGKTIEYPPPDDRYYLGLGGELTWLSAEPPMFTVSRWEQGESDYLHPVILEGCAESEAYGSADVVPGPGGLFAIVGDKTSLRWGGKELRVFDERAVVRFAPAAR